MRLSIVTINYDNAESTIKLLESLANQSGKDFELILVDNNSEDVGKLSNFTTPGNNLIFIKNGENLGFSGGNNVGIRQALKNGSDWVLLLNNDTWLESDFTSRLKAILEPGTGIVGIPLDEDGRLAYCGKLSWLKSSGRHIYDKKMAESEDNKYAIGGAMAIHRKVIEKIGLLDENYFLYFEDQDFSLRAKKAGFPLSFTDEIKVTHQVSSSTKKLGNPLLLRYHYRNALYFNWKNGPWYIKLMVWPWSWVIVLKQAIKILVGRNKDESRAILKGAGDWYAGKMGKIKLA